MPTRTVLFFVLLAVALGLVGFPDAHVPVPDRLSTSRDWEDPANAELFETIESDAHVRGYGDTVYTELGKQSQAR